MRATLLLLALATPAFAEDPVVLGPLGADPESCAAFVGLDEGGRVKALMGVEPLGDDIGQEDEAAARDWADAVAHQCAGHPEMKLTDAAAAANAEMTGEDDN